MLVIEMEFPAGRYHATPWGRNVNEGEAEWPPSPYRLARALVDAWKRRRPEWSEERVSVFLKALSGTPKYSLPPSTVAHTRSYLSSNDKDVTKKQLIFDTFVVLERKDKVLLALDNDLDSAAIEDLNELLERLNYLGRSESWIKAKVLSLSPQPVWNCKPARLGQETLSAETLSVACLLPPEEYTQLPHRPEKLLWKGNKLQKTGKACTWVEAVCLSTRRLLEEGWSAPPALLWSNYASQAAGFIPEVRYASGMKEVRCVKYQLVSTVLPRVTETASFAEKIRRHLMGIHKRILNDDPTRVSQKFSGKDREGRPLAGHRHAFYLPYDENGDGRLDHLLVCSPDPFDPEEMRALDSLRSMWQSNGRPDVDLILVRVSAKETHAESLCWVSATPFVTSRHYRKGRGAYREWLRDEVIRECRFHGLPEPASIEWVPATVGTSHPIRWIEFHRNRKGRTPLRGYGCILGFNEPVAGPFSIGAGCHFGLGLFQPYRQPA